MTGTKQRALLAAALVAGLGACQGSGSSWSGSPDGIPIAVESIDGPPPSVKTAFASELVTAATERKVELAGSEAMPRYRVRGYLSAETDPSGETALAYVWDVFDAEKRRAKRLTGSSPIPTKAADPWSGLDKETLAKLASASMDEIADFLSQSKAETPIVTAEATAPGPEEGLAFTAP